MRATTGGSPAKVRKRRIPTACGSCRYSKAKCDGKRPCSRCRALNKECAFEERPKDAQQMRIEMLETQLGSLKAQLQSQSDASDAIAAEHAGAEVLTSIRPDGSQVSNKTFGHSAISPLSTVTAPDATTLQNAATGSPESVFLPPRRASHFDTVAVSLPDFIDVGLLSPEQARVYFEAFFHGSDRYVPVFDPLFDTPQSVRSRSSILFCAICTVGCRVLAGTDSQHWRLLNFHIRRLLNAALVMPEMACLETVQALLVRACYTSERSLLVSVATRMALTIGLPEAYDELMSQTFSSEWQRSETPMTNEPMLMRKTRTWLFILVMGHILHVDAGDILSLQLTGNVRRCRVLLHRPTSAKQDLCLWPQIELNSLRARIQATLSDPRRVIAGNGSDQAIMDDVRDAIIDLDVWFADWARIYDASGDPQAPWLKLNLQVQRCWGVTMALCRAVRTTGVEDVSLMTTTQKDLLRMARDALRQHLDIIVEEPRLYLLNLRYAMDFVWAKCVFCYLLLLKLSILLPEPDRGEHWGHDLVSCGNMLLDELSAAGGDMAGGHRSGTGRLYLQLLRTGIEKYSHALDGNQPSPLVTGRARGTRMPAGRPDVDDSGDADAFVPDQFVFEWDFPGLTLFSSSATEAGWLDGILLEALSGADEFMGFGWTGPEAFAAQ
ncbi:C6 zinc finger domain-containingprotein [Purpureocillium lilacinum]|uniref:C6 zinc finger domain-containingprotein n=1 Tax=Purpureocillium lilacinum TaxID=33203 RepID=A0A179GD52_PURLI|nr:C6 zinc finger domain-containingprotein [Purpureocillium lilacinum]OAQ75746.1 C6 zinc finger domain-containingprotein [Purpureocillium lilacinum]